MPYRLTLAFAVLVLLSCTAAAGKWQDRIGESDIVRIVIENDNGGSAQDYIDRAGRREPLELRGDCFSACTIYLSNPKACVHPDAILGFHAAYDENPEYAARPHRKEELKWWNAHLMSVYPPKVRKWIENQGGLTSEWLILSGEELRSMVPICPYTSPILRFSI